MRGLIIRQPYASRIVQRKLPFIVLPKRAKTKFIDELIEERRKIVILSTMTPDKPVDEELCPLGKAVGTVEINRVIITNKEDVLSGNVSGFDEEYIRMYPWNVSRLGEKVTVWYFEKAEQWNPPVTYTRVRGPQRWIRNVKLKR